MMNIYKGGQINRDQMRNSIGVSGSSASGGGYKKNKGSKLGDGG